jgi:RNA recognition motif-containing protein
MTARCVPVSALAGRGLSFCDAHFLMRQRLMNIYVGNLAYGVTQDELREAFAAYGDVESANLITDKFTGQSKGFGFVEMPNNSEADAAIKALNETPLKGRPIRVNQAKPRAERPARGGGGGGQRW